MMDMINNVINTSEVTKSDWPTNCHIGLPENMPVIDYPSFCECKKKFGTRAAYQIYD